MRMHHYHIPFRSYALLLFSLPWFDQIRRDPEVGLEKEHEPEMLVHERQNAALSVDIAARLVGLKVSDFGECENGSEYLDAYRL